MVPELVTTRAWLGSHGALRTALHANETVYTIRSFPLSKFLCTPKSVVHLAGRYLINFRNLTSCVSA